MKRGLTMKKCRSGIMMALSSFAAMAFVLCLETNAEAANISINFPSERAVFQRDAENTADITVNALYSGDAEKVQARIVYSEGETEWAELSGGADGDYEGVIEDVKAGGWYALEVEAVDAAGASVASGTIEKIGVGEVFITGGQSNSCNFGGAKTTSAYDEVSALNASSGAWQHCADSQPCTSNFNTGNGGGSPWPTLGDALVEKLGVPVGFISTGHGGAKISELNDKMYYEIKAGIDAVKPYGCRAFLIHQGEADTPGTPFDEYAADFEKLIQMTRDDFEYDINWIIAQVSYAWSNYNDTAKMEAMTATQRGLCNNYNIFVGPTTDDLLGDYRHTDNLHLSEKGLIEHGTRWANVIIDKLFTGYALKADESMTNGKIVQCGEEQFAGNTVKLTAVADKGYYLVPGSFKVSGEEGEIELTDDSFVMRAEELTVSAEFAKLPAYFDALDSKVNEASAINSADYEAAGVEALKKAVEAAKAVYANPNSDEATINKATADVDAAIRALVKKTPVNVNNGGPTAPVNPDADVKAGDVKAVGNLKYKITSTGSTFTVSVAGLVNKNKSALVIPKAVKIGDYTYKVTAIEKKAFAGAKKLKKITIKSTTIKKIGKNAFSRINVRAKFKVPAKKLAAYKKLIKKSGFKKISSIKK